MNLHCVKWLVIKSGDFHKVCFLSIHCLIEFARLKFLHSHFSWYSLESKPGKKKKERGRIQVSIQFMRNNMTASMFDLSMKEKPRSPFSKLKDRMKGRKHDSGVSDTSSAILPRSAVCDSEPSRQALVSEPQPQPEAKVKRPLLAGTHKLSAAHSMSDLIGTHFRPKLDSMNSIEESGEESSYFFFIFHFLCVICHIWQLEVEFVCPCCNGTHHYLLASNNKQEESQNVDLKKSSSLFIVNKLTATFLTEPEYKSI